MIFPASCEHWRGMENPATSYGAEVWDAALSATRSRRTAIDVGAHVGIFTCRMLASFNQTVAIEPCAENAACLKANAPQASILEMAALDRDGLASLRRDDPANSGRWSIAAGDGGTTRCVMLDSLGIRQVDLLKIDTEGTELQVLQGAKEMLARDRPTVIVELNDAGVSKHLEGLGYRLRHVKGKDSVWVHRSRIVIYTALFGQFDPRAQEPEVDFPDGTKCICFTDRPFPSKRWKVIDWKETLKSIPQNVPGHPAKLSRWFKLLPQQHFPWADRSIWVDANTRITRDPLKWFPDDCDLAMYSHPTWNCLYREIDIIIRKRKDLVQNAERLRQRYQRLQVPPNAGLAACGVIWRIHTASQAAFDKKWWAEYLAGGSIRDQPAFGYLQWHLQHKWRAIPWATPIVKRIHHPHRGWGHA